MESPTTPLELNEVQSWGNGASKSGIVNPTCTFLAEDPSEQVKGQDVGLRMNGRCNYEVSKQTTLTPEVVEDPWALPELKDSSTPWRDLNASKRALRVTWHATKFVLLLGLLYMFICSLDILSSAFRLLGGKAAGEAMSNTVLFNNPVAGLMLGILCTVLVQSSSTSTSIMVSMVSSDLLPVRMAVFMVMGANVGTTVTNTIVALGQAGDRGDFRRAFAAATVHDMFNWLSVLVFLPLEWAAGYLYHLTKAITRTLPAPTGGEEQQFLKVLTQPLTDKIIKLSSSKIRDIAQGKQVNGSLISKDDHIFNDWSGSDAEAGGILLGVSLVLLCVCLFFVVKLLSSLLRGTIASIIHRIVNCNFREPANTLIGFVFMAVGAGLTILVQSSSVFTSALTPLVGMGAIHIDKMYTLTLGSNIGTTVTGILAALASSSSGFVNSFQVALCHLFFNISGIAVWYPIPVMRNIPIRMAKYLGDTVFVYRWFSVVYLFSMFFLLPVAVFGLSLAGWEVLLGVGLPVLALVVFVVIVNIIRQWRPHVLPARLQSWEALGVPRPLRSLEPYDRLFQACMCCKKDADKPQAAPEVVTHTCDVSPQMQDDTTFT